MFTERGKTLTRFQCGWEFIPNDGCSNRDSSEHITFGGQQLPVVLSIIINVGYPSPWLYVPKSMLKSVIVPIIKNKNNRISDKDNYKPICIGLSNGIKSLMMIGLNTVT